jgi:flagellin
MTGATVGGTAQSGAAVSAQLNSGTVTSADVDMSKFIDVSTINGLKAGDTLTIQGGYWTASESSLNTGDMMTDITGTSVFTIAGNDISAYANIQYKENEYVKDGESFTVHAGYWTASNNMAGLEGDDATGKIYDIGKYVTNVGASNLIDGDNIKFMTGYWQMDQSAGGGTTASLNADEAAQYFDIYTGANSNDGASTIAVDKGTWNMTDEATGKVTKDITISSYFSGSETKQSLGATTTGQTIKISGAHWEADDTTLGENGNVGDASDYFTLAKTDIPAAGNTVYIKGATWTASGGIDGDVTNTIGDYVDGYQNATAQGDTIVLKASGSWNMKETGSTGDGKDVDDISEYFASGIPSNIANGATVDVKAANVALGEEAEKDKDYTVENGKTATKTYDLSSLNDGDRVKINGTNYTYRAKESDVKNATDFHTGDQLQTMSQAIKMGENATGDGLDEIIVSDQYKEGDALSLQVGDTNETYQKVGVDIKDMSTTGLGLKGLSVSTQEDAANAIDTIQQAVNAVSTQRGKLGALQNRLDHTPNNLDATTQNITAAESQIRDVDMAKEMTQYSKNNILVQAAQSMLAQANSMPQGVLSLLQ